MYGCTVGWNEWRTAFTSIVYRQYRWQLRYFQKTQTKNGNVYISVNSGLFFQWPLQHRTFVAKYPHRPVHSVHRSSGLVHSQGFSPYPLQIILLTTIFHSKTWQSRISPYHDNWQNCNRGLWLSPRYERSSVELSMVLSGPWLFASVSTGCSMNRGRCCRCKGVSWSVGSNCVTFISYFLRVLKWQLVI